MCCILLKYDIQLVFVRGSFAEQMTKKKAHTFQPFQSITKYVVLRSLVSEKRSSARCLWRQLGAARQLVMRHHTPGSHPSRVTERSGYDYTLPWGILLVSHHFILKYIKQI